MKYQALILATSGLAAAREISLYTGAVKREVPQEHSHEAILRTTNTNLKLDNPLEIQDAVFSLLGNAAAANGAPNVDNLDCLQQIVADQAFTNAKAAGDVDGMANAIMFRALERNTAAVGQASVICNETATNPEIAAITQHQDPASAEASGNKQIALDVAKQLSSIGADPTLAIQTGTFAPGDTSDNTGAGNTCDDENDAVGCIISQNLLVADVTEDEINAAVGGTSTSNTNTGSASSSGNAASASGNANSASGNANSASGNAASSANANAATGTNVQTFTGSLGGAPPPVTSDSASNRPFTVNGDSFVNAGAALQRSCAVQHNACANAANSGSSTFTVADCETQEQDCNAAASSSAKLRRSRSSVRREAIARQSLDFGSCGSPAISFGTQKDRSDSEAFAAVDQTDFNHGSALAIKVISDFICQQLDSKCKASAETVSTCQSASAAAAQQSGQASADAFNSALGVSA